MLALRLDGDGMTRTEIIARDAVLLALDRIVESELGDKWTLEKHMKRKHELLEIVDGEVTE